MCQILNEHNLYKLYSYLLIRIMRMPFIKQYSKCISKITFKLFPLHLNFFFWFKNLFSFFHKFIYWVYFTYLLRKKATVKCQTKSLFLCLAQYEALCISMQPLNCNRHDNRMLYQYCYPFPAWRAETWRSKWRKKQIIISSID